MKIGSAKMIRLEKYMYYLLNDKDMQNNATHVVKFEL